MDTSFRTIYVENFPLDTTEDNLREIFSNFGKIKRLELPSFPAEHPINKGTHHTKAPKTKGYAFIEFSSKLESTKAINFYNDLNNILHAHHHQHTDPEKSRITEVGETTITDDDDVGKVRIDDTSTVVDTNRALIMKINCNSAYKHHEFLRVMSKETYDKFTKRFEEQKFKSLVGAAKLLVIS